MKKKKNRGVLGTGLKTVLANRFRISGLLGKGTFGEVYCARDSETGEIVAVKLEKVDIRRPQVLREAKIVKLLNSGENAIGIPSVIYDGNTDNSNIMVQELLGRDLEHLFNSCKRNFTLKTILMLSEQILQRMEYVHSNGIIHRDIKPQNWTLGVGKMSNTVYLFDFGLAKRWRDSSGVHIMYRDDRSLVGTARYASINSHLGIEQSRRDDLESVGYMFIYLLKGKLPWQGLVAKSRREKYRLILNCKTSINLTRLCDGLPDEFRLYLQYVKRLGFEENPDYKYLINLFRKLFVKKGYTMDYLFDWTFLRIGLVNTNKINIRPSLGGSGRVKRMKKGHINPQL